ncbi:uncharacterized protein J4E79_011162 [Alternaria viburni]|uniref:uncharacterized protein n=1 Tax=Alternaria viburni TaxID=566460 RepID=UPI0020C232E7|nr:uncharacterized protein J4E79_011162 [Alternaria viburni]KAI4643890.1 hypothetical protein J4E79_011162 [Alternaria viburni]
MSPVTATAHAKVPSVGGGAFKDRDLANRALESEERLRELMGMLHEAVQSLAQELEADDEDEWEDVGDDDEELEYVDDENDWEDIDDEEDDEELEDDENEDGGEDIDDDDDSLDFSDPSRSPDPSHSSHPSSNSSVENLLVKWYHKDDVTALVKTLIESAQASYAQQEEFWKDRRIVQEWFGGIDR